MKADREPPTKRQRKYAAAISAALKDGVVLYAMDKWQMRDYISKALESAENRKRIYEYTGQRMRHEYEMRQTEKRYDKYNKPYLSDESLGGEWGLDASDFGAQAWGDS